MRPRRRASEPARCGQHRLVIDCDPGHDDAIAILLALASPEVGVTGITTVAGNQTIDRTTRNALAVLELAGREYVPVARGADGPLQRALHTAPDVHGETGLDGARGLPAPGADPIAQDAATFLATHLGADVTLVAIGPLTNVALALDRGAGLDRVVWMGGGVNEGDVTELAEFNAFVDPEAAEIVFSSGAELTMIGLDVTHRALVGPQERKRLLSSGRAGRFVAELLDFYGGIYRQRHGWHGPPVHDALALAVAIDPTFVRTEHVRVHVHNDDLERGRTEVVSDAEPNAHVAFEVDAARFLEFLCARLEELP